MLYAAYKRTIPWSKVQVPKRCDANGVAGEVLGLGEEGVRGSWGDGGPGYIREV